VAVSVHLFLLCIGVVASPVAEQLHLQPTSTPVSTTVDEPGKPFVPLESTIHI